MNRLLAAAISIFVLAVINPLVAAADSDAQAVIARYESEGYWVNVNRSGRMMGGHCTVTNERKGPSVYRTEFQRIWAEGAWRIRSIRVLDYRTIQIFINCV
ncbi:hypothetical protein [Mycobacteroides chelonae]|uniref:hypothetical protein n=1 Tax=Mycobacteroides chelonae TaxID=1774 RepID=UPI001F41D776|nr:hypothetical protein [Mycobacteroides chelonae]